MSAAPAVDVLRLRGFKIFGEETQTAPLARVTFVFGDNPAGKSSIVQALLVVIQTSAADSDRPRFRANGPLVGLGRLSEPLHVAPGEAPKDEIAVGVALPQRVVWFGQTTSFPVHRIDPQACADRWGRLAPPTEAWVTLWNDP